jgi:hypothetical protein
MLPKDSCQNRSTVLVYAMKNTSDSTVVAAKYAGMASTWVNTAAMMEILSTMTVVRQTAWYRWPTGAKMGAVLSHRSASIMAFLCLST